MRELIPMTMLAGAIACGPSSPASDDDESTTTTSADATDDGESTTSSTSGATDASSEGALDSTGAVDTSTGDESSTGDPFTYSADESLVELICAEQGPRVYIEIYPGILDDQCLPAPDVDPSSVVLVLVEAWDGKSGTYEVGPDGPARVGLGAGADVPIGTVALDVVAPWTLASLTIDVSTKDQSFAGTADQSMCAPTDPADPCA
jgi:hypothetical protein